MAKNVTAKPQKPAYSRGYARNARDEAILLNLGLKPEHVYVEGRGSESLARLRMRQGEMLATTNGLRALGDSRWAIVAAVKSLHEMGAVIVDASAGLRSDKHGVEMLDRALADIRGELSMRPGQAREMQRKSARARVGDRMAQREALIHWRDPALTIGEAIKRMPGWSARTAYMRLGKRNLPRGPIGKRD